MSTIKQQISNFIATSHIVRQICDWRNKLESPWYSSRCCLVGLFSLIMKLYGTSYGHDIVDIAYNIHIQDMYYSKNIYTETVSSSTSSEYKAKIKFVIIYLSIFHWVDYSTILKLMCLASRKTCSVTVSKTNRLLNSNKNSNTI